MGIQTYSVVYDSLLDEGSPEVDVITGNNKFNFKNSTIEYLRFLWKKGKLKDILIILQKTSFNFELHVIKQNEYILNIISF